ncbi:putative bifunctional diguanylate cyclase/phosphodiesterase [Herbaspirillum rubrisubalbicans]|uniref:putative bifunctional diguanylate cyclase/phosphodiesterase n=1 Tax=Herbaspirillum rubrisubalbicans TaxID=80842 RepID=UPI0002E37A7E|nr:GGDEF domain-containing response regulator [Herbaspirillum rubrisubalbicans]
MRLLVIDDDTLDRMSIVRTIRAAKVSSKIVEAATAKEGLSVLTNGEFDAVLLDFRLPDMDCLDVLHAINQNITPDVAVIVLTGGPAEEELERRCIEAGAQDFLLKSEVSAQICRKALLHAKTRQKLKLQLLDARNSLQSLAENDPLTGLSNRYFFDHNLSMTFDLARQGDRRFGVLFIDLDNFKLLNDCHGHAAGDTLLKLVARRLLDVLHTNELAARLGGDEFAIIAHDISSTQDLVFLSERIIKSMEAPFIFEGIEQIVTCSIGIATYPECGQTAADLCRHADLAMYHVKKNRRNGFYFYSEQLQTEVLYRSGIENALRSKNLAEQLRVFYQPFVNAQSLAICGAEVLVRWQHPTLGLITPDRFISIAEECGVMAIIDGYTRGASLRQLRKWFDEGRVDQSFQMAVNISASTLHDRAFPDAVRRDLECVGRSEVRLSVEVTENILVANFENATEALSQLREMGVTIALDDFGTGYSSMSYLRRLPISTLKVDKSFMQHVPQSRADVRLLKSIITLAKSLELEVIVEGVETFNQMQLCQMLGADILQGYYFSKPLMATDFERELSRVSDKPRGRRHGDDIKAASDQ